MRLVTVSRRDELFTRARRNARQQPAGRYERIGEVRVAGEESERCW